MIEASAQGPQIPAEDAQNAAKFAPDVNTGAAKPRGLCERRENFCQHYIVSGNGTRAAINAGYSAHAARQQASRLLTNANILQRISDLRRDIGLRNRIDRDTVMAKLEAAYRGAMTGHMYFTAVRAAEAQARLAGLFPERAALRASLSARARALAKRPPANGAGEKGNGNGAAHFLEPSHERR